MRPRRILISTVTLALLLALIAGISLAQRPEGGPDPDPPDAGPSTTFTYQGRLMDTDGNPMTGTYDFRFQLCDGTGAPVSPTTNIVEDYDVEDGLVVVQLTFGDNDFNGDPRYLQVEVREGESSGDFTMLLPRQELTAAPYALYAGRAPWSGLDDVPADLVDGDQDTTYGPGTGLSLVGTTFSVDTTTIQRRVDGSCSGGSAISKVNEDGTVQCEDVGGGSDSWSLTGNTGTVPGTHFLGTSDNQTLELRVNNAPVLRLQPQATSPNVIGGHSANNVTASAYGATIGGGGTGTSMNLVTDDYGTVGGGAYNRAGDNDSSPSTASYATVAGGFGNEAGHHYATVGGGLYNSAEGYGVTIGGGDRNQAPKDYATVGGGNHNTASGWAATIAGGDSNVITGTKPHGYATIAGGRSNEAAAEYTTIGGGRHNWATANYATIAGGGGHIADYHNAVSGEYGTIGGGSRNGVVGDYGTVPGGEGNTAWGHYSFAAGRNAYAADTGSFVFSSSVDGANSWGANTFTVRAHGGTRFYSGAGTGSGVQLSAGSSSWGSISDRNVKENFFDVDSQRLLNVLAAMPVQTWNLKSQTAEMRHIGPVAQDFNGTFAYLFGEVEDAVRINTMDAVGVSLAAAQGLYELSEEQATHIEALEAENAALQQEVDDLEARVSALERAMSADGPAKSFSSGVLPGAGFLVASLALVWVAQGQDLRRLLGRGGP